MNFRLSTQQRERHDRAECDDLCPACALIEAQEGYPKERRAHYFEISSDYPEEL